jgi:hypothetical protein
MTWYRWAIIRVCPSVERGECLNAGVVLFSREARLLACRIALDEAALLAMAPAADVLAIQRHLGALAAVADGDPDGGAVAALAADARFDWLTAPRSGVIQVSAVHEGQSGDLDATCDALFDAYVARSASF